MPRHPAGQAGEGRQIHQQADQRIAHLDRLGAQLGGLAAGQAPGVELGHPASSPCRQAAIRRASSGSS
jgi:hypothetical protein